MSSNQALYNKAITSMHVSVYPPFKSSIQIEHIPVYA